MGVMRWLGGWGGWGMVLAVACGDDGGGAGQTDATGSSSGEWTTGPGVDGSGDDDDGVDDSTSATGPMATSGTDGGTDDTGTTGGPDEGEFAGAYRIAFLQIDAPQGTTAWVEVDENGTTEPVPLLPGGDHAINHWTLSPSRRWLVVRGGSDAAMQGWVVDAEKLGPGPPDTWAEGMMLQALTLPVFFPDEDAFAYGGQDAGVARIYARTLGDALGPAVDLGSGSANAAYLAGHDGRLVFATADAEIHTAPMQLAAAQSEHAANLQDTSMVPVTLWLSADGSAVYARDPDGWWIAATNPASPPTLAPIALAPEPAGAFRSTLITPARNRILVIDSSFEGDVPDPLTHVTLDGPSAAAPVTIPIPAGPDGTFVGVGPQVAEDGDRVYVAGSTARGPRAAYAIDLRDPVAPIVTAVAGPGIDDADVVQVLLSHDEARLFYTTSLPDRTVKMVDAEGSAAPIDLAPDLVDAIGAPGVSLVESEDGRAVFFLGQAKLGVISVYRVGIVDGVPTPAVAMGEPLAAEIETIVPAPDGGGVVYVAGGVAWMSMYADAGPTTTQLSTDGFTVDSRGYPTFLAFP